MWTKVDESIRERIIKNINNVAFSRLIVYLLFVGAATLILFLCASTAYDEGVPPAFAVLLVIFLAIGIISVLTIYYQATNDNTRLIKEATIMIMGKILTVSSNDKEKKIIVKIPGEKMNFKIACEHEVYKFAQANKDVLILTSNKKNESVMYGVEPSTYDKDGVL